MIFRRLTASVIRTLVPPRPVDSHKGRNGHILIIAGSRGMSGAAVLASLGALRAGAGLVTVAVPRSQQTVIATQVPEVLTLGLPESPEGSLSGEAFTVLNRYVSEHRITVGALGPGLSTHLPVRSLVRTLLRHWTLPLVLDADGLNNCRIRDLQVNFPLVITPHPGELGHLLGLDKEAISTRGRDLAMRFAMSNHIVCVLKGHQSFVTDGAQHSINTTGNSAMATGGTGDVLTGIIAGLLGQGLKTYEAACAGVYLHGLAGDLGTVADRGLLARDVAGTIPEALRHIGR